MVPIVRSVSARVAGIWGIVLAAFLSGCGAPDDDPRLVPVSGKVTFDGQPLLQGSIGFSRQSGHHTFSGVITDGKYTLMASHTASGALPGEYRVSITAVDEFTSPPVPLIPTRYFELESSGLTATVSSTGGTIDFELEP